MFLVGGAILRHGIAIVHHWIESFSASLSNGFLQVITPVALDGAFGIAAGIVALLLVNIVKRVLQKK
jgi:predicted DNA repair protein MutK